MISMRASEMFAVSEGWILAECVQGVVYDSSVVSGVDPTGVAIVALCRPGWGTFFMLPGQPVPLVGGRVPIVYLAWL